MLIIGDTLISDDVVTRRFTCHVEACKAACCVEGDSGAPLSETEARILDEIYPFIVPFLTEEGKEAIAEQGKWILDTDGEIGTPTLGGRECAYSHYDAKGILKCGIEQAFEAGKVTFRKPISCHLYPIRIKQYKDFKAVNYHHWDICNPGCALGETLGIPVYRFLKDALISCFGDSWYEELCALAEYRNQAEI